jgi:hypothetical protein
MRRWLPVCVAGLVGSFVLPACVRTTHKVELEVKPIHITMDINIKVQRDIDAIFDEIRGTTDAPQAPKAKAPETK